MPVDDVEPLRHRAHSSPCDAPRHSLARARSRSWQDAAHAPDRRRRDGRRSRARRDRPGRGGGLARAADVRDHPGRRRRGARRAAAADAPRRRAHRASTTRRRASRWTRSRPRRSRPSPRRRSRSPRDLVARRRRRRAGLGRQHRRLGARVRARAGQLLQGVRRAALAAVYPTELRRGEKDDPFSLILDVGATIDVTAEDLVGFAVMGSAYAKLRLAEPPPARRAALERRRGRQGPARGRRGARARCVETTELNFIGNVEGLDIPRGVADVVVCSGFVGNVVLKMLEGVSRDRRAARPLRAQGAARVAARPDRAVRRRSTSSRRVTDWEQYGGAPLLGFDASVHQGARPLERARDHQRGQGRAQGARRQPVRQHRAHDGRARRARAAARDDVERMAVDARAGSRKLPMRDRRARSACSSPTSPPLPPGARPPRHTFRWDLDKTYLRTEFDSLTRSREERVRDRRRQAGVSRARPRCCARSRQDGHRICIVSGSPDADAPGARREARARRRRVRRVRPQEQPARTSCAAGSARCARRSATSCRRCCARGSPAAAERRDAVRRRRRGRRDHLLPVRRPHRRPRRRSPISSACSIASRAYDDDAAALPRPRAARAEGRRGAPHLHPPRSPLAAARASAASGRAWCRSSTTSRPRSCSTRTRCCRRAR